MTQDIDRIIARHLGSTASPEEESQLQAWLAESEQNRRLFAALVSDVKPDTGKAWAAFERHLHENPAAPPLRATSRRLLPPLLRYAAAVALLVGTAALAWVRLGSRADAPQARLVAESAGEVRECILSDSSGVFLNRGSKLCYVGDYGGDRRELLLEGEAFFAVSAASSGQLVVRAGQTLIRDVGTTFNVQAYPADSAVTVFVQRGEVRFYTEAGSGVALKAGETGVFDKRRQTFSRRQTDANATAYVTKTFVFKEKPLREVVALIGRVYGVSICVSDSAAAAQVISVTFDGEELAEMVEVISETMSLRAELNGSAYLLSSPPANSTSNKGENADR